MPQAKPNVTRIGGGGGEDKPARIIKLFEGLSDEQRSEVFQDLVSDWCMSCGAKFDGDGDCANPDCEDEDGDEEDDEDDEDEEEDDEDDEDEEEDKEEKSE